jgi:glycosyltransferase involved in cell wall biosynthesis
MAEKSVLLLSAYDTASHVYWREGLVAHFPEYEWQVLTLPPRYFSWRVRGNSLSWAFGKDRETLYRTYDVIIATSMVDLSALRGFLPHLADIPTIVYFHENQFFYPRNDCQHSPVEQQLTSIYTALCADKVVFNSTFNRKTFQEGVRKLLKMMPDHVPENIADLIEHHSLVLPVPLRDDAKQEPVPTRQLTVTWNHRWEYDKGPDRLLLAVQAILARNFPVKFNILGQKFRQEPGEFAEIHTLLDKGEVLATWGPQSRKNYLNCLRSSHVVLSTSMHEFQGLAVMEAVAAGCVPLVPDRLAYQDDYPLNYRYASHLTNPQAEAEAVADRLEQYYKKWAVSRLEPPRDINLPWWHAQKPLYQKLIVDLK